MTVVPAGAQLGPADLPPPPPSADPREPSPTTVRGRSARTPQRARSPATGGHHSRGSSPSRPPIQPHTSSDASGSLIQPVPRPSGSIAPLGNPIHCAAHLSRPSSPASIHSSSSAIFERDIELPAVASLSINPNQPTSHTLTHKASRLSQAHGSPLDHTVPAVLDDAVEALAGAKVTSRGLEGLEIEAPTSSSAVAMARQSSASLQGAGRKVPSGPGVIQLSSRSPSPVSVGSRSSGAMSPAQSPPIMGQLAAQQATASLNDAMPPLSGSVPRPAIPQRISTGPQLPGGWAFGHGGSQDKVADSASSTTDETPSSSSPPLQRTHSPSPPPAIPSHLTPTKDKRRISFISYNDLLLSVPTTVTPLGDITSGNLSPEHLPGTVSPTVPTRSPVVSSSNLNSTAREVEHKPSWDAGLGARGLGLGEGEWQREGLGKGLEQRLEDLVREDSGHSPRGSTSTPPLSRERS